MRISLWKKKNAKGEDVWMLQWADHNKEVKTLSLGTIKEKQANTIMEKVKSLNLARITGTSPDAVTFKYFADLPPAFYDKFVEKGLVEPREDSVNQSLEHFLTDYIAGRNDITERRRTSLTISKKKLMKCLGGTTSVRKIGIVEAKQYDAWLHDKEQALSEATISSHVRNARLFWREAVEVNLTAVNPFLKIKVGSDQNPDRYEYISMERIQKIIDVAPDNEFKCLIACSRILAVRIPSEIQLMEWSHIDFKNNKIKIISPKTKKKGKPFRFTPLFPAIVPYFETLRKETPKDQKFVFNKYRQKSSADIFFIMHKLCEAGGTPVWEKVMHNLRASRINDMRKGKIPRFDISKFVGNTPTVNDEHYNGLDESDYAAALTLDEVADAEVFAGRAKSD